MRERIYQIVEQGKEGDNASIAYNILMLVTIFVSIIPLMFAKIHPVFRYIEDISVSLFIIDYMLRWITADYRLGRKRLSFLIYPFTGWAMIDLLSILPALRLIHRGFKIIRITRLLRVLRLFKLFRYAYKLQVLSRVIKQEKGMLLSVLGISVFYVFLTALIMFNVEPRIDPKTGATTFKTFFDALYWATVTLTTVGYGDLTPASDIGRFITMLSSLFGLAVIALPSGVITASYLQEIRRMKNQKKDEDTPEP